MSSFDTFASQRTIDAIAYKVIQILDRRNAVKQLDEGIYGGPLRIGRNGQVLGAFRGGQNYGWGGFAVTTLPELKFVVPLHEKRRFRALGVLGYCETPPGIGSVCAFDIRIAPPDTAPDGTWYSIFVDQDAETYPYFDGTSRVLSTTWALKTEIDVFSLLTNGIDPVHPTQFVYVPTGWLMGLWAVKQEPANPDGIQGAIDNVTITISMELME